MNNALLPIETDALGGTPPAPGEAFRNRIIHPRNIEIEQRRENARILKPRQLTGFNKEARRLDKTLQDAGYYDLKGEYSVLKRRFEVYQAELEELGNSPSPEQLEDIQRRLAAVTERARFVRSELKRLSPFAERHQQLTDLISDHYMALEKKRLHDRLTKELAKEAYDFAEIIIEKWAQLGYKYEYHHRNKLKVDKVGFSDIHVSPDAIWLKIDVSRKSWFGFKSTLPNNVRVLDLIDRDKTLPELSVACQRQVTAEMTVTNGAWIKINRIGTTDGLLNYVTLEQVLNNYPAEERSLLPVGFGVEEGRVISWVHLAKHPHFLIGGSTGAGKSNIINAIICSLLLKHSPDEVRFVLVDLKEGLEFQRFENVPHLLRPVVKEVDEAEQVLRQLESERKRRSLTLAKAGVKDIDHFNLKSEKKMARIVIIFDEYAAINTQKVTARAIQDTVMQLSAKGRAAGIHLIISTQNPNVEILPGTSKANMAFRVAGAMPTTSASSTILGVGDAAKLPDIPGRMLAMCGAKIWQIQTPHVREVDLERALETARKYIEEDVESINLPEAAPLVGFSNEDLITIMLNDFDGVTATRRIFDVIKETESVTFKQLSEQMQALIAQKRIQFKGEWYEFEKFHKGRRLVKVVESAVQPKIRKKHRLTKITSHDRSVSFDVFRHVSRFSSEKRSK